MIRTWCDNSSGNTPTPSTTHHHTSRAHLESKCRTSNGCRRVGTATANPSSRASSHAPPVPGPPQPGSPLKNRIWARRLRPLATSPRCFDPPHYFEAPKGLPHALLPFFSDPRVPPARLCPVVLLFSIFLPPCPCQRVPVRSRLEYPDTTSSMTSPRTFLSVGVRIWALVRMATRNRTGALLLLFASLLPSRAAVLRGSVLVLLLALVSVTGHSGRRSPGDRLGSVKEGSWSGRGPAPAPTKGWAREGEKQHVQSYVSPDDYVLSARLCLEDEGKICSTDAIWLWPATRQQAQPVAKLSQKKLGPKQLWSAHREP